MPGSAGGKSEKTKKQLTRLTSKNPPFLASANTGTCTYMYMYMY